MSEINMNGSNETGNSAESAAESFNQPKDKASDLFRGLDIAVPEGFRAIAEQTVNQSREAYETAKETMEQAIEALEKSLDKAGQGAAALNRKAIDVTQTNLNSGFDLAKDMAGAKNVAEIMELQAKFMRDQFGVLAAQAEEIRTLTSKVAEDTATPIKDHVSRSVSRVVSG
jgi:phasin